MKATLRLEYIGESEDAKLALASGKIDQISDGLGRMVVGKTRPRKPWVAKITGKDAQFGLRREFLPANWQRKRANSTHSRGVELWFILSPETLYEVSAPVSWRSRDRYFCTVDASTGRILRLANEDADRWLNDHLASMS